MKYSERFFKFPVKLYRAVDWRKVEKNMEMEIGTELEEPPYAKGWEYCDPELIANISPSFSAFVTIEELQQNGPKLSLVHFKNGKDFVCYWSCDKFLQELDKFMEQLDLKEEQAQSEYLESIKSQLEEKLGPLKEEYEKIGITLNVNNEDDN